MQQNSNVSQSVNAINNEIQTLCTELNTAKQNLNNATREHNQVSNKVLQWRKKNGQINNECFNNLNSISKGTITGMKYGNKAMETTKNLANKTWKGISNWMNKNTNTNSNTSPVTSV